MPNSDASLQVIVRTVLAEMLAREGDTEKDRQRILKRLEARLDLQFAVATVTPIRPACRDCSHKLTAADIAGAKTWLAEQKPVILSLAAR